MMVAHSVCVSVCIQSSTVAIEIIETTFLLLLLIHQNCVEQDFRTIHISNALNALPFCINKQMLIQFSSGIFHCWRCRFHI